MTQADLDAIQARCAAATPGPWVLGMPGEFGTYNANTVFVGDAGVAQVYGVPVNTRLEDMPERYAIGVAVGQFIAHARSDVPALLAEVQRLKGLVEAAYKEGYNEGLGDGHPLSRGADSQKRWVESNAEYDLSGGIR